MKKLKLVTNGIVHGASVLDENGEEIGRISEIVFKEREPEMTLVKIGSDEFKPTPADLENWKQVFEQAATDKDFRIFTHNAVEIERFYPRGNVEIRAVLDLDQEE
jgi:sporulation protein YlmC with PRC-barrel domain